MKTNGKPCIHARSHFFRPLSKGRHFACWRRCALLGVLGLLSAGRAPAQSYNVLHQFSNGTNDGANPYMSLVQGTDGNFYGTTYYGGASNRGTIFRINSTGSFTDLYQFKGSLANDGAYPEAALLQASDGNFYGTTYEGGSNNFGVIFRMTPAGVLTNLHIFQPIAAHDGRWSYAPLIQGTDGLLYGTTTGGGTNSDGTVFQMTLSGNESVIYSFSNSVDGNSPDAGLFQGSDGNFYGTAEAGGSHGVGTFFRITSAGVLTPLHEFGATTSDGQNPYAGIIQGYNGNYYGTTYLGGSNSHGTVFMMTSSGVFTNIYNFGGVTYDGLTPQGGVIQGSDSYLYGATYIGGTNNDGALFKIGTNGGMIQLHAFGTGVGDGTHPLSGVVEGSDGNYYGATYQGGTNNDGAIFQFVVPPSQAPNQLGITAAPIAPSTNQVNISFASVAGETLQLQSAGALLNSVWTNVPTGGFTNSIGGPLTITDIVTSAVGQRFYRLQITP